MRRQRLLCGLGAALLLALGLSSDALVRDEDADLSLFRDGSFFGYTVTAR